MYFVVIFHWSIETNKELQNVYILKFSLLQNMHNQPETWRYLLLVLFLPWKAKIQIKVLLSAAVCIHSLRDGLFPGEFTANSLHQEHSELLRKDIKHHPKIIE